MLTKFFSKSLTASRSMDSFNSPGVASDDYRRPASNSGFRIPPYVVGAEGRFVLLSARFYSRRYYEDELFMYTAGESPSLERLPLPDDEDAAADLAAAIDCLHGVTELGIVPRGLHYLVAALCDARDGSLDYHLHIYSSESKTLNSKTLPNTGVMTITPEKVITIGEGVLGWVDFSHGLLVCNLCQEPPSVCFIPLPKPLPANRDTRRLPGASPRLFRDLICADGMLKFIEMEPCNDNVVYDSDLIRFLVDSKDMDGKPKSRHGWRATTWSRMVSSNCWCKEHVIDVADLVDDSTLLSGPRGETAGNLKFRDLYSVFPTLGIDNGDILYLKSAAQPKDRSGWMVAVDLRNKAVKSLRAYPLKNYDPTKKAFRTSTLSCHLVITPGIKVSAYRKITQVGRSANNPNNASIHLGKHVPWKSRSDLERLVDEKLEKLKRTRDESHSSIQNDQSRMKQKRLSAQKIILSPNKAQNIVQNDPTLHTHTVENNLSQQQCLNKWNAPCYPGKSPCPQQNKLLPGKSFYGFCMYAPLAPTPILHDNGNYQPLCQPSPWKQHRQQQPGSEFVPHEASQQCFNQHYGASYNGYSWQLRVPNSAYGPYLGLVWPPSSRGPLPGEGRPAYTGRAGIPGKGRGTPRGYQLPN